MSRTIGVILEMDIEVERVDDMICPLKITFDQKDYEWDSDFLDVLEKAILNDVEQLWREQDA